MGILKEFLVSLGLQDDLTGPLDETLQNSSDKIGRFTGEWGKNFILAGGMVISALAAANVGVAKFLGGLVKADDELTQLAKATRRSRDEAYITKSALDAMGKSMAEIQMNPKLLRQYRELRENAARLKPPDMSEGLDQVRAVTGEFTKLKQTVGTVVLWVGHYLLKYIERPLAKVQEGLGSLNDILIKNAPAWAEKVGAALSWIVRLGVTLLRGAGAVYTAIKRVFDMIPGNVKTAMAVLAAFALFIRAGPIGQLITILTGALLLLDDFFTFLDGGEAQLGPVWKALTGLFSGFTEGGHDALNYFSNEFLPGLFDLIAALFPELVKKATSFVGPLLDFAVQAVEGFITILSQNIPRLVKLLGNMGMTLFQAVLDLVPGLLDAGARLANALLKGAVGMLPGLIDAVMGLLQDLLTAVVEHLPKLVDAGVDLVLSLVDGIVAALPGLIDAAVQLLDSLLRAIFNYLPKLLDAGIKALQALANGLVKAIPKLIGAALDAFERLYKALAAHLPDLIRMGVNMLLSLVKGLVSAIPQLLASVWDMVPQVVDKLTEAFPKLLQAGWEMLSSLISGLLSAIPDLLAAMPQIVGAVLDGLDSLSTKLLDVGKNVVKSLWNGILSMGDWLKGKVSGFFSGVWDGVKDAFGMEAESTANDAYSNTQPLPGHADGGVFATEHVARFAEGNQAEAVVPLTKPARASQVLGQIQSYLAPSASSGGGTEQLQAFVSKAGAAFERVASAVEKVSGAVDLLSRMQQTMSGGVMTTTVQNSNTTAQTSNSRTYDMKSTFNIYDSSGNPQSTARAVDHQMQLRIRNMQGVLA